jgi:type VI secretion system protein ImpC
MSGQIDLSFQFGKPQSQPAASERHVNACRILVMGSFSGRDEFAPPESRPLAGRRLHPVDVDNFEDLLSCLAPRIACAVAGPDRDMASIEFHRLDDFHPDRLYQILPAFQALRDLRARLLDPKTFREAADELRSSALATPSRKADTPSVPGADEHDVVALGLLPGASREDQSATRGGVSDDFHQWINQLVAPHLVPAADPMQSAYLASIDNAIADLMRRLLHDRSFQAIESNWRGLARLVRNLSSDEELKVFLLDVSKSELHAEIERAGDDLRATAIFRLLVDDPMGEFGDEPWSMLVGNYTFGSQPADLKLLAVMGAIASHAGGPFVAAASPEIVGCRRITDLSDPSTWTLDAASRHRWQALRTSPFAAWLALAMPRILLRTPYGKQSDPIEEFAFEEISEHRHDAFLWGNPALACALLAGQSFLRDGRLSFLGQPGELDDLPTYVYKEDGQSELMPCAEVVLTSRAAEAIMNSGIIPLLSHKSQSTVIVPRFQSLVDDRTGSASLG